jgi:hypothetical protein
MSGTRRAAIAALAALGLAASAPEPRRAAWSHLMRLPVEQVPAEGLVGAEVPPMAFHVAEPDLHDLRLIGPGGQELPYVVRFARGSVQRSLLQSDLYNRALVPGDHVAVTADFGERVLKNRLQVVTSGADFRREVLVEGSNDAASWATVRDGAFLLHWRGEAGQEAYVRDEIELPENDYRYLRVTVHYDPRDPERMGIEHVRCWRFRREPAETLPAGIRSVAVAQDEEERQTDITLDLGCRHLPLAELRLRFGDASFFRRVAVFGRNSETRKVRVPREDAAPLEEVVEEPWHRLKAGAVHRYPTGAGTDESLALDLSGAHHRYLQVRIHNMDSAPLRFEGAGVTRYRCYVEFQPEAAGPHVAYLGNPAADPPRYDLARYAGRLRRAGVHLLVAGEVVPNPAHEVEEEGPPASERYAGLIWLALLIAMGVLALVVYRQVAATRAEQ